MFLFRLCTTHTYNTSSSVIIYSSYFMGAINNICHYFFSLVFILLFSIFWQLFHYYLFTHSSQKQLVSLSLIQFYLTHTYREWAGARVYVCVCVCALVCVCTWMYVVHVQWYVTNFTFFLFFVFNFRNISRGVRNNYLRIFPHARHS